MNNHKKDNLNLDSLNFCFLISKDLHSRLDKHLQNISQMQGYKMTKQHWISEAVNEKLEDKKILKTHQDEIYLKFKLSNLICQKIQKKIKTSFQQSSQKKWILDAIIEKLDRDEMKYQEIMQEYLGQAS